MRVAFDARYLDGREGGVGRYTLNLVGALLEEDPRLELLLILRQGAAAAQPRVAEWLASRRVESLDFGGLPNVPGMALLLARRLRGRRFDLFHSPFHRLPMRLGRPTVLTVHDLMWLLNPAFQTNSRLHRALAGAFLRSSLRSAMTRADRILTVSRSTRRAIGECFPWLAGRVRVSYNGFDRRAFGALARDAATARLDGLLPRGATFVLVVGDPSPHKNHANAVRGFLRAFEGRPEVRLVIVRRALPLRPDRELDGLLGLPGARGRVLVLPHVPGEVLNALYHTARVYLQPSYYEGFGIPLLEAMAAGVPILASKTSCLPEVCGNAALYVDPAVPDDLAEGLRLLDRDEPLRERLVANGTRRLSRFSWRACARATLETYREIA
jgi:glycosyltransferase involved in cell wall biosynthesis